MDRLLSKLSSRIFSKGDEVLVRTHPRTKKNTEHKKLKLRCEGPYIIIDAPPELPNNVIIQKPGKIGRILVNKKKSIKKYHKRPEWMTGIDEVEEEELMEETEHLDPPITTGKTLEEMDIEPPLPVNIPEII